MWTKIIIFEIRKDALLSLRKNINGTIEKKKVVVYSYYYVLPIIISLIFSFSHVTISNDIANYFITAISIFAGLFFNLLLVVADKMNARKQMLETTQREDVSNYVKRYKHFSEQLISQIAYAIILAISLIILMFFTHFKAWLSLDVSSQVLIIYHILGKILNFIIFVIGIQLVIIVLVILSSMYIMLLDDIKLKR